MKTPTLNNTTVNHLTSVLMFIQTRCLLKMRRITAPPITSIEHIIVHPLNITKYQIITERKLL